MPRGGGGHTIATILSGAMMLRYSFGLTAEADAIEAAVDRALNDDCRTYDIAVPGGRILSGSEMTAAIIERI